MSRLHLSKSDLLRNYKIEWLPWWSFRYIYLLALPFTPLIAIFCDRTVKELASECVDFIFAKVINDIKEKGE
ncbi:MAG: hypothetical protein GY777_01295 [Candidatus Brocadiaceae bacterium]|nr:hypothetical protein [Candidatus Brocadiaceae bacterium]